MRYQISPRQMAETVETGNTDGTQESPLKQASVEYAWQPLGLVLGASCRPLLPAHQLSSTLQRFLVLVTFHK